VAPDTIVFAAPIQGRPIELDGGQLEATSHFTIDGGDGGITLDALGRNRVLEIVGAADVALDHLTIANGRSEGPGGGIVARGASLTISNSTILKNGTTGDFQFGGGLAAFCPTTLTNCTVAANSTTGEAADRGGIFSAVAITLIDTTVSGNSTSGANAVGAGLFTGGTATLRSSILAGNAAAGEESHVSSKVTTSDGCNLWRTSPALRSS
jgi:hypothetical protein